MVASAATLPSRIYLISDLDVIAQTMKHAKYVYICTCKLTSDEEREKERGKEKSHLDRMI